jgi:hypothetical protein
LTRLEINELGTLTYIRTTPINAKQGKYVKETIKIDFYSDHAKEAKFN